MRIDQGYWRPSVCPHQGSGGSAAETTDYRLKLTVYRLASTYAVARARFITVDRFVVRPSAFFALRTRAAPRLPSFLPA